MFDPRLPALVLAPMEGITDAPMRRLQGETGVFTYTVSEFIRVSADVLPPKVFPKQVPELVEPDSPVPVQVQILGGDPDRLAQSAVNACLAGAPAIDINFGCPAKTVNRHDGGASLLLHPDRIRDIVAAVKSAVPKAIPVSAKLRLGWEDIQAVHENAARAAEGGADWLTIHARTRMQGYSPPVYWPEIGRVRRSLGLPVIANGDIWTLDDFLRCRDETGCHHFMIGRGALSNPDLPFQIATELGLPGARESTVDWYRLFSRLCELMQADGQAKDRLCLMRLKQWMKLAHNHGQFPFFDELKTATSLEQVFEILTPEPLLLP